MSRQQSLDGRFERQTMICRLMITLALCRLASAEVPWACQGDNRYKPEPNAYVTGVEDPVMYRLADRKVVPNVSDVKGKGIESVVVIKILVGTDGSVRCARLQSADPDLAQRSIDAARKWHYRPYWLKRNMVNVETYVIFNYTRDTVESLPPLPR